MSETRNLFHLQCSAKIKRANTANQFEWLLHKQNKGEDLQSSKIIIRLERKFFLSRKQSQKTIDTFLLTQAG